MTVLIAGGGIAGLSLGLTLHQIGIPFLIFEAVPAIRPFGVGINLQPNAVRELFALGLEGELEAIGVRTRDYGFYSKRGLEIWTEPRGIWAGYNWPQFSVHRGRLQMLLHDQLLKRAGADCIVTGQRATVFENLGDGVRLHLEDAKTGDTSTVDGALLIGADGIHSAIRRKMAPDEGEPVWAGAVMWRGTTEAAPFLSGASMVLIGHATQRFVAYPISKPNPATGKAQINWIAELTCDPSQAWRKEDWNRQADASVFLPRFEDWQFDWLNVPAIVQGADRIFEYPMVDRDPIDRWTDDRVTLMGDAAHPTYPVGSNGASQAIVDARLIGARLLDHGIGPAALVAYSAEVLPMTRAVTLANRGSGPDAILQAVEDRCGGQFDSIDEVMRADELAEHAARYKALAGFSIDALNTRPDLIQARPDPGDPGTG